MNDETTPVNAGDATARPTGKRQVAGVATTSSAAYEAKKAVVGKTAPAAKKEHTVATFFPEVVSEMKRVIWPTARQMLVYTLVVFAFLIILTAIVWGVDTGAGLGVEKILKLVAK